MKKLIQTAALMGVCFSSALAHGQTVFFDDFDGDALLPHWFQPSPSTWEYDVSDSMLNVTGLFSPSHPKSPSNYADLVALFPEQSNFRMDVSMGWDPGDQPHSLTIHVLGPFGGSPIIASMGYRNMGASGPTIFASASNQGVTMQAPPPGIHQFTISRTASQYSFLFNGVPFGSIQDVFGISAAGIWLEFLGPYPGQLGPFHVDWVEVQTIPAPGSLALLMVLPLLRKGTRCD